MKLEQLNNAIERLKEWHKMSDVHPQWHNGFAMCLNETQELIGFLKDGVNLDHFYNDDICWKCQGPIRRGETIYPYKFGWLHPACRFGIKEYISNDPELVPDTSRIVGKCGCHLDIVSHDMNAFGLIVVVADPCKHMVEEKE